MAVKSFKPYSAGRRFMTVSSFEEITTDKPEKSLVVSLKKNGGRNQQGRLTVRHQGGGHKRRYRIIDFKRTKDGIPARVATIEYDPNRSARIALLNYVDGEKRYILAPNGLKVGDKVESGPEADIKVGNALPLKNIPVGTMIHNIEMKIGKGGQLIRSAGTAAQLMAREGLAQRDNALRFLEGLPELSMETVWREAEKMGAWKREELAEWLSCFNMSLRDMLVLYEDGGSQLIYQEDCRERLAGLLPRFPEGKIFALLSCVKEMQKRLGTNVNLRLQLEGFFIRLKDVMD